jgi:antitoxin (DNA-binding transcriptional repressor) of toxin-antitoxin stability system
MHAVDLKVLKRRLGKYLRLVAAGECIVVTQDNHVIAEIVPPRPERRSLPADPMIAELVREGLITPAVFPPGSPPPRKPMVPFQDLMDDLQRDREDP